MDEREFLKRHLTRRGFLRLAGATLGLGLVGFGVGCGATVTPQPAKATEAPKAATPAAAKAAKLVFTGWNAIEMYGPPLDQFMKENPDITVEYRQMTDYKQQTALLAAGEQCDVIVAKDDYKAGYVDAGFIQPVESAPGVAELTKDMYEPNLKTMTYKGHLYGLPYYTDFHTVMYNYDLLTKAGVKAENITDLNALRQICIDLKKAGVAEFPLGGWLYQESNFKESMYGYFYASKGREVDENWNPVCAKEGILEKVLDWMKEAMQTSKYMDVSNLQMTDEDMVEIFQTGKSVFQGTNRYDLRKLNDPTQTKVAKQGERVFRPLLYPGLQAPPGQGTLSWTRMYTVNAKTQALEAAFRCQYFMGGKNKAGEYWVARDWWHKQYGLGFAYKSLASDPAILVGEKQWGDPELFAKQKLTALARWSVEAGWYAEWDSEFQVQWHKACLGQISSKEAAQNIDKKWTELKK